MKIYFIAELALIFVILYGSLMYLAETVHDANMGLNQTLEREIEIFEEHILGGAL